MIVNAVSNTMLRKCLVIVMMMVLLASSVSLSGCDGGEKGKGEKATGTIGRKDGVWVTSNDLKKMAVYRLDPISNTVVATINLDGLRASLPSGRVYGYPISVVAKYGALMLQQIRLLLP